MRDIERILNWELRRDRGVLPHVRRRHARRLAAAIEAEGNRVTALPVPQLLPTSPAGLDGQQLGAGMASAIRAMERFLEDLEWGLSGMRQ